MSIFPSQPLFLPFGVNDQINPITGAGTGNSFAATIDRMTTFVQWAQSTYVTVNNTIANYLTIRLVDLSTGFIIASYNTIGLSAGVPTVYYIPASSFNVSFIAPPSAGIYTSAIISAGAPGNLYLWGPLLQVYM